MAWYFPVSVIDVLNSVSEVDSEISLLPKYHSILVTGLLEDTVQVRDNNLSSLTESSGYIPSSLASGRTVNKCV